MSFDKRCLLGSRRKQGILSWKMEGKADKLLMTTIAERSSSYLFYGLYITHPSVPRLGLTNFLLWRFLEFKRNWLFERRLSSNQQLKTLLCSHLSPFVLFFWPCYLSTSLTIPALWVPLPRIRDMRSHYPDTLSKHFDISDSTISTLDISDLTISPLWDILSIYFSIFRSLIPLSQHFQISEPTISALLDLWSHYQHY
jgi:hypothetical protein